MKSTLRGGNSARYILCNHPYEVDYLIQVMLTTLCLFSTRGNFVLGRGSSAIEAHPSLV
jgi:hypothetical protein